MDFLTQIFSPSTLATITLVVTVLFGISEALAQIPAVKANSVFEAIFNGLSKIKDILTPKQ